MGRTFTVGFGPSRSKRLRAVIAEARRRAQGFFEPEPGRYRARFVLGDDPGAYASLARVIELVRGWRASEVLEESEPVSPYLAKEMAWCASTQLRSYGRCRFRFAYGVMPRCSLCPLFDPERAIRDSMGEFQPTGGVVIELGPAIRAALRGDPVPPEEEALDAGVPQFVPEDWGGPPAEDPLGRSPSV
jgi:hypothetical protein